MLRRQDFSARVLVVDKSLMSLQRMRNRETFYNVLVQMVLRNDNGAIQNATLILDESVKSKQSKQQLTAYLRKELNAGRTGNKIREVRYHRSHTDSIIQAADMLSGAIYTHYHRDNGEFLAYIRVKVADLWEWNAKTQ